MKTVRRPSASEADAETQTKGSITVVLLLIILWLGPLYAAHGQHASSDGGFELENGDRVVFLGGTFIEAAQEHGYIELALTTRWPDRNVTFRNVGWAGDTVFGDARRHFTNPPGPYERLLDEVAAPDPTVLIVGYGSDVPFGGDKALSRFEEGLNRLLDDFEKELGARIVLLSPPPHEADASPVPADVVRSTNESLKRVAEVIAGVARARGHRFVDVFSGLQQLERETSTSITDDGVQLNAAGYYFVAHLIEEALGLPPRGWSADLNLATGRHAAETVRITNVDVGDAATITLHPDYVPMPRPTTVADEAVPAAYRRQLTIKGLPGRVHALTSGAHQLAAASADEWAEGIMLGGGPDDTRSERLRRHIVEKNRLYYHQYRPQNETYLVGFRAYEQGQNANELRHFSPLIDEKELEIGRLREPAPLTFRLGPTANL